MTKAQQKTLDKMRKKRELKRDDAGSDHRYDQRDDENLVMTKDGDRLAILPNGLTVPQ